MATPSASDMPVAIFLEEPTMFQVVDCQAKVFVAGLKTAKLSVVYDAGFTKTSVGCELIMAKVEALPQFQSVLLELSRIDHPPEPVALEMVLVPAGSHWMPRAWFVVSLDPAGPVTDTMSVTTPLLSTWQTYLERKLV
ncbi:hypothetical protein BGX26_000576 [Mortierella sp. AD094]|nr:hypothetical protein BGX26_000576 [Mortierella sp. AD094]